MSSRTAGVREIASVRALMAREIVGQHAPGCSPIAAYITLWRMWIRAALRESLSPGLGG